MIIKDVPLSNLHSHARKKVSRSQGNKASKVAEVQAKSKQKAIDDMKALLAKCSLAKCSLADNKNETNDNQSALVMSLGMSRPVIAADKVGELDSKQEPVLTDTSAVTSGVDTTFVTASVVNQTTSVSSVLRVGTEAQ